MKIDSDDPTDLSRCLFQPGSIALVGASADKNKHSALPHQFLRKHGFAGHIYPVNPRRSEIFGERSYADIGAIGKPVDHALITLPVGAVAAAVSDCARNGVRCATILSNGFAEAGAAGLALQEQILAIAKNSGMRILGPNSMGLVNTSARLSMSPSEALALPALTSGSYGLISQSGSLLGALLSRAEARGIGFSKLVSVGNESDLGVGEIGQMLVDDPKTSAILLFLETIRWPDRVEAMARHAFEKGKPVIAYCLGRSEMGGQLAASHTGAIAGSGVSLTSFLRDVGIIRVDCLETLIEIPPFVAGKKPTTGRKVSIVSTTGGGGALLVDNLAQHGVVIEPPSDKTIASLAKKGISVTKSPLIDLTLAGTNPTTYGAVLDELMASEACDCVIAVVGASAQYRPDRAVEPIVKGYQRLNSKPLAAFLTPEAPESLTLLRANRIAGFRTPEACADAVRAYLDWCEPRVRRHFAGIDKLKAFIRASAQSSSQPIDAAAMFQACGIPQAWSVQLPTDLSRLGERMGGIKFPVAAKIISQDIAHKTDCGGVVLGLDSIEALTAACEEILKNVRRNKPSARLDGIQVQTMERGLAEVLIGYRRDPQVGPTITLAMGGVLAEIYRDSVTFLAPVNKADASKMIESVRGLAILRGYRGLPPGDLDALAEAIVNVSALALIDGPNVLEAEINPLLVKGDGAGVVAVDALMTWER